MFKFIALAGVFVGIASGAVITSGTIVFSQPFYSAQASVNLSDGVAFTSGGSYDFFSYSDYNACNDYGSGCLVGAPRNLSFGPSGVTIPGIYIGFLTFSYAGADFATAPSAYQTTFQLSGTLSNEAFGGAVCPFPDSVQGCSVDAIGSGTVVETISSIYVNNSPGATQAFYVSRAVYTFTQAPEPSTFLLIAPIALVYCRRARNIRAAACE